MAHIDRRHVLEGRIRDGVRWLAELDAERGRIMAELTVAAAELDELLALHEFLAVAVTELPMLSLAQWRAIDLIERCTEQLRLARIAVDARLLASELNRARYNEVAGAIARMREELAALDGGTPAAESNGPAPHGVDRTVH